MTSITRIIRQCKPRKIILFISLAIASCSLYFILIKFNISGDPTPLVSLFFSVVLGLWQWLESRYESEQRSLAQIEARLLAHINDVRFQSQSNDEAQGKDISYLMSRIEAFSVGLEGHIKSSGHTGSEKEIARIQESLIYIQALVNIHTEYARIKLIAEKMESHLAEK